MTLNDVPLYKVYLDYRHADDLDGLAEAVEVAYQEELAKLEEVVLEPLESQLGESEQRHIAKFIRLHNNSTTDAEAVRMFKKLTIPRFVNESLPALKGSNHYELAQIHMRRVNSDTEIFISDKKVYLEVAKNRLLRIGELENFDIREAIATYYEMFWWDLAEITE